MNYTSFKTQLKYYNHQHGRLAYFDGGRGKCILLLHGVPTSSWLYRKIIPSLLEDGYRVVAPDMLGYGASDKPKGYEVYSSENMGKRILALMQYLKIDRWSHVFHDGGGLWTWAMLEQDRTKVDKLMMLNTIVYQEGFCPPIKFEQGIIARLYSRLYSSKMGQNFVLNPTFKNGVENKGVINVSMLEGYKLPLLNHGHHPMYYFFTQTCRKIEDYSLLHRSLDVPLCVIWGESDDVLVWNKIDNTVRNNFNLSEKDIHLITGKHFIQEEQPEKITQILLEFVSR